MWSLIIIGVLFLISIACLADEHYGDFYDLSKVIGVLCLLLAMGGIVAEVVVATSIPTHLVKTETKANIVALSNSTQINGTYFLLSGSLNQEPVYYYFQESNGGFVQNSISANNVTIYQDTVNTGYILTITETPTVNAGFAKKFRGWAWYSGTYGATTQTQIHVPPNTIVQQFSLDLAKQ